MQNDHHIIASPVGMAGGMRLSEAIGDRASNADPLEQGQRSSYSQREGR